MQWFEKKKMCDILVFCVKREFLFLGEYVFDMRFCKKVILGGFLLALSGCGFLVKSQKVIDEKEFKQMVKGQFKNIADVVNVFPKSVADVEKRVELSISGAKDGIAKFLSLSSQERNFDNTPRALDSIEAEFGVASNGIEVLEMISPQEGIRKACHKAALKMREFAIEAFFNKDLYLAFKDYVDGNAKKEDLNSEQKYFLQESMQNYIRHGFDLSEDEFNKVKDINKELAKLGLEFDTNINTDQSFIKVKEEDLKGLEPHFLENLGKAEEGEYILKCDYPTYFEVMENCLVEKTRKDLFFTFMNRAYPKNLELLNNIIAKRDALAKMLKFDSYSHLDLDSQMVKNPKRAQEFLKDLSVKTKKKEAEEFKKLIEELPKGIQLDKDGKMSAWDFSFVKNQYKKKHFDVDEREIAKYFPVENTIEKIFEIYQQFLGLDFKQVKADDLWHEEVKIIEISDKADKEVRGYLFLDLYPRENKFSHACMCDIVSTTKHKDKKVPSVIVVIANFPKATKDRPALLKHNDVTTFFHEFGHAMHGLLGRTELASFSGTSVKRDFVEMPSQMFEEWMWNKDMLKKVSKHYKKDEPLSDELIDKKIELKKFGSGYFVSRQCWLSLLALEYFAKGAQKDTDEIKKKLHEEYLDNIRFEPDSHFQASFGHLVGYGAKYYGYMWAKVFALDLFYEVKKHGLLDLDTGKKLEVQVLGKGGSVAPDVLLKNFLGREPSQEAFLEDLGISG